MAIVPLQKECVEFALQVGLEAGRQKRDAGQKWIFRSIASGASRVETNDVEQSPFVTIDHVLIKTNEDTKEFMCSPTYSYHLSLYKRTYSSFGVIFATRPSLRWKDWRPNNLRVYLLFFNRQMILIFIQIYNLFPKLFTEFFCQFVSSISHIDRR